MRLRSTSTLLIVTAVLSASIAHAQKGNSKSGAKANLPVNSAPPSTPMLPPVSRTVDVEKAFALEVEPGIPGLMKYPRVDGSTSTIPIGQLLLARSLGLNAALRRMPVDLRYGFANAGNVIATFDLQADSTRLSRYASLLSRVRHNQTHEAYENLARGAADLILVAREPSADELATAAQTNVAFDVRPVALDAFIFIANSKNDVTGLTQEQIRGIYSGATKNWKDVGGADKEIYAVTRGENSGSQELMKKFIMHETPTISGATRMAYSMIGTLDMVAQREDRLAYSVYYYERVMSPRPEIKLLAVDGVLPTPQTISDRSYPLVEPVYIVTRKDITPDGPAATLRDWLLSADGQKLIAQSGYVPISPATQ